jgi:nucleoside-diphosphate-sugar epimerase
MRVLLIGGNGFIGTPVARQLHAAGHQVALLHRAKPVLEEGISHIRGDRNQLGCSRDQLKQFGPDVIVDFILSSGEQARELMEVARGVTGRVVALSSGDVYRAWGVLHRVEPGGLEPLPLTEESPLRSTRKLYSPEMFKFMREIFTWVTDEYDKIAVEEAVMGSPYVSGTVLRLPMVYGPGDPLHRFFPLLKRIADRRPAVILPENLAAWRGPRGYVENLAQAVVLALTSNRAVGRVFNVCDEPCLTELDWEKQIAQQAGWTGNFVILPVDSTPEHLRFTAEAAQHVLVTSQRIRDELGYRELISREQALRRTIAWEMANPPETMNLQQFDYTAEDAALVHAA